jgi:zinc protease
VDDLRDWYRQWYAPNNATLVVVGDVDAQTVFDLARKHFGPLKAEQISAAKHRPEPPQLGEKRIEVKAPAKEPYVIMGYKTPALSEPGTEDWEPYALEMLSSVLDGGSSTRLSRDLVRGAQVAAEAGASYSAYTRLPGMLVIDGTPAKGHDVAGLERALAAQIQRLQDEPVGEAELERIRTQLIANKVYELDSVYAQAMKIGMLESTGLGWPLIDQYVAKLSQVTPAQIQAVARKYLTADDLTVAVLDPQPLAGDAPAHAAKAGAVPYVR